ncbi:MAG TPA: FkbM family methyltransferase [Candidatus Paceibacterota bacterium]
MWKKIKLALRGSKAISRSLLWQLLTIWQSRLEPLSTIYKDEKISAIKHYLRNDWEYIKFKREINAYKTKEGYDFDGIKLPPCVITPDYFLNVFKPHIERLVYKQENIAEFYRKQKTLYPTLIYCKDVCLSGEPKYVGAHIVTHGFTYFFNEITIERGDVVLDLGAAPGDFAALCAYKGASKIYTFEPEESAKSDLEILSRMSNNAIEVVRWYAGLQTNIYTNTVSLDDFVKEKGLLVINFIKADIEGNEADMLRGATEILRTLKPKLIICTYHRENDPDEIETIILSANETYTIYKEPGVLYAF